MLINYSQYFLKCLSFVLTLGWRNISQSSNLMYTDSLIVCHECNLYHNFPIPVSNFYPAVWNIFLSVQIRDKKRAALLKEKRSTIGSSGTPRVIVSVLGFSLRFHLVTLVVSCGQASSSCKVNYFQVLVGLSSSSNVGSLAKDLLTFAEGCDGKLRSSTVASPTYKLRTTVSSK